MADEDDDNDVYICHKCVGDAYLKDEICSEGRERACEFCGQARKAWPVEELAERVQVVIEEHFRVTPSDPWGEGVAYDKEIGWERRGEPVADLIAEIAQLDSKAAEAVRECLSEKTSWDAYEGGYEDPFGDEAYYEEGKPDTYDLRESWDFFRREIKTRSRFFGQHAQRALDKIFGDLSSLKTWQGTPAIKEILPTDEARFFYRARIAYSESDLHEFLSEPVKQLGPPPSHLARAGRMNAAGISVFYGAMEADTCIAEARAPVGSYVVLGRFEIMRPVHVLDLDVLTTVVTEGSWFDPEFATRSNRAAFLRNLVAEISRPIMPRDEEFEYLPTQAVSEYLASCVEPPLDGIIFHSAQTAGEGRNVVLFNHSAGVEPYVLPDGTKLEVDMGWASDDDYDDSITVWETVPGEKPAEENSTNDATQNPEAVLELNSWEPSDALEQADQYYGEPTLRLDVQNIQIYRIRAVSYEKSTRSATRYRRSENDKSPF